MQTLSCLWQKSPIRQGSADRPCKPLKLKGLFLEIRQFSAVLDFCLGLLATHIRTFAQSDSS
jgi:hypothetical protein